MRLFLILLHEIFFPSTKEAVLLLASYPITLPVNGLWMKVNQFIMKLEFVTDGPSGGKCCMT